MSSVEVKISDKIATITINRPKVNALNETFVNELRTTFFSLEKNDFVSTIILTGKGSFFSFGFDVPGFMSYPKSSFGQYVTKYSELVKTIFMFPKPVIAAIGGHAVAGGCVLAMACDQRVMVAGKAKIALNEMTFGSSLFSCVTETLKYAVGSKQAEHIVYSGKMFSAEQAHSIGMVDKVCTESKFESVVMETAQDFANKDLVAFASIKKLFKSDTLSKIENDGIRSISEFVDIWYSDSTRKHLEKIEIRD